MTPAGRPATMFLRMLLELEPWRALAAVMMMTSLAFVTGASVLLLVPLLQLVGLDVGGGTVSQISRFTQQAFSVFGLRPTLVSVLASYVVVSAASAGLTRMQASLNQALSGSLVAKCRRRLYDAVGHTQWAFFSRSRASDYTHALVTECDRVGAIGHLFISLTATALVTIVYVLFALRVSWPLTLLVFASAACLMLPLKRLRQKATNLGERSSEVYRRLHGAIADTVLGMKTVRTFGARERQARMFADLTEEMRTLAAAAGRHYANVRYAFEVGTVILLALVVYIAFGVQHLQAAEVLLLLFLFARIVPQVSSLEQTYLTLAGDLPAFATVIELERRCLEAAEPRAATREPVTLRQALELRGVTFGYGEAPVVSDLNFDVPAGSTTALVGPSGAGKTTVADLIIGLVTPDRGAILADGQPLSPAHLPAWRDQIGYVAQDALLFHDTVRANLLWARQDASVDDLWEALRLAAADDFVARLPRGLDTIVGDDGMLLSGGERQRLALARALIRKPALLLLDEATSSLDFENERRIHDAIDGLHGRVTILTITHRLASVRHADVIHVLDAGRIVESGAWDDLMRRPGGRLRALQAAERSPTVAAATAGGPDGLAL